MFKCLKQEDLNKEGLNKVFRYHVSCVRMCQTRQAREGSHEGLILYLKENVLGSQTRQEKRRKAKDKGSYEGLIL